MLRLPVFSFMVWIDFADGSRFEAVSGEVWRHGAIVRLEPQPAAVLKLLVARPGELVTHGEIRQAVWGEGTHVNFQDGLHYAIRQIRVAFEDSARAPWLIETIPRRGYRLVPSAMLPHAAPARRVTGALEGQRARLGGAVALLVLVVLGATTMIERHPNNHHELAVAVASSHPFPGLANPSGWPVSWPCAQA